MQRIEYTVALTKEDKKKVVFDKERGEILHFVVQYYSLIDSRWRSVMRFDTCHGYAHRHTFHRDGREYVVELPGEYDIILTESIEFITQHYEEIKRNYLN